MQDVTETRAGAGGTDDRPGECWCCGARYHDDQMVHLGNHPEVAVCVRCAHSLHKWAGEIEDKARPTPAARLRGQFRRMRKTVVRRNWHRSPLVGRMLRRLGRYLP